MSKATQELTVEELSRLTAEERIGLGLGYPPSENRIDQAKQGPPVDRSGGSAFDRINAGLPPVPAG